MSKLAHTDENRRDAGFVGSSDHVLVIERAARAV